MGRIVVETVSTYCQPVDRRINLQWEPVDDDDCKIPQNAFVAGKFKTGCCSVVGTVVYIGRYKVGGDTFSGPVLAKKGLIYLGTSSSPEDNNTLTTNEQESGFEVLVINNRIQPEWVPLTNNQWPCEYTPIPCGELNNEVTLIGRVQDVGIGHVKIHKSANRLVCYIPRLENSKNGEIEGPRMFTDDEFSLLCVK